MFYSYVGNTRNKIYHIGYNCGKKFINIEKDFNPTLGVITNDENLATKKTYHNELIEVKEFLTVKDWYNYKRNYSDLFAIYDDIDPCYQFINYQYPDKIDFNLKQLSVLLFDIETNKDPETNKYSLPHEAKGEVSAITIKDVFKKQIWVLSTEKFYPEQMKIKYNGKLKYKFCYTEIELLQTFVKLIDKIKPDIISGYNSSYYDDTYMINRCNLVLGEEYTKHLSPIRGKVNSITKQDENGNYLYDNTIEGIALVDYMALYQKNVGKYESNSLSFVAGVELGEDKVNYEEYDNLEELRINNPQKFVEYNIYDVELLDMINDKRKLLELIITVAYFTKSNFDDVMSPIKTWDNFIYSYLRKQGIVIPPRRSKAPEFHVPGGYVKKDVNCGIFKNVISLDLKALYPSLSISLNISPDTLISDNNYIVDLKKIDDKILYKQLKHDEDTILTGSGWKFKKDKIGFYPALFKLLMSERDVAKGKKLEIDKKRQTIDKDNPELVSLNNEYSNLHTFEQSVKLLMNSGYGIIANNNCRYYDPRLAASITLSGQLAIKSASNVVEKYLEENFGKSETLRFTHTDSVGGESIIVTDKGKIKISDFYNDNGILVSNEGDKTIKCIDGVKGLSFNTNTKIPEYKNIKYVMRHKAKKTLYSIKYNGNVIRITEDHSLIVNRNGKYMDISPRNIKCGDKIILLKEKNRKEIINENNEL